MEAAERRKVEERERRIAQERERIERQKAMREKVAAQTFARGYMSGLMGNVFDRLYDSGLFFDPVQREIETDLCLGSRTPLSQSVPTRRFPGDVWTRSSKGDVGRSGGRGCCRGVGRRRRWTRLPRRWRRRRRRRRRRRCQGGGAHRVGAQRVPDIFMAVPEVGGGWRRWRRRPHSRGHGGTSHREPDGAPRRRWRRRRGRLWWGRTRSRRTRLHSRC